MTNSTHFLINKYTNIGNLKNPIKNEVDNWLEPTGLLR